MKHMGVKNETFAAKKSSEGIFGAFKHPFYWVYDKFRFIIYLNNNTLPKFFFLSFWLEACPSHDVPSIKLASIFQI